MKAAAHNPYAWIRTLLVGSLTLLAGCGVPAPTGSPAEPDNTSEPASLAFSDDADPSLAALPFVEDELLVQTLPGAEAAEVETAYRGAGAAVRAEVAELNLTVLEVDPAVRDEAAATLEQTGLFENIQKNYVLHASKTPNDPAFPDQHHLPAIGAPEAWEQTTGATGVRIAIVDTGVDTDHPDLASKIVGGWNVYDNNADYGDVMGHGTSVAGSAAALSNNGTGVSGVAWDCPLLAVRAAGADGASTGRHLAAGILWGVSNGARVINVSFAPLQSNSIVRSAVQYAYTRGCLVVIASGNSGQVFSAAGYDEGVFVGATDSSDVITSFSDEGPYVDLSAPGLDVLTTGNGGGYEYATGTSFASPIVAGVAALAWSANPDLRPVSIVEALTSTAIDLGTTGKDRTYGYGRVDAQAAVEKAAQTAVVADTTAPTVQITRPAANSSQSKRFSASVTAKDASGIADVVLSIDGIPVATDSRTPFTFTIDPSKFAVGRHTMTAVATDIAGNSSTAATSPVTFSGASSTSGSTRIAFTSPVAGTSVSANTTIAAQVSNTAGLTAAEWLVDGQSVLLVPISGSSSSLSYLWRAASEAAGSHTISLVVTDQTGAATTATLSLIRK